MQGGSVRNWSQCLGLKLGLRLFGQIPPPPPPARGPADRSVNLRSSQTRGLVLWLKWARVLSRRHTRSTDWITSRGPGGGVGRRAGALRTRPPFVTHTFGPAAKLVSTVELPGTYEPLPAHNIPPLHPLLSAIHIGGQFSHLPRWDRV